MQFSTDGLAFSLRPEGRLADKKVIRPPESIVTQGIHSNAPKAVSRWAFYPKIFVFSHMGLIEIAVVLLE